MARFVTDSRRERLLILLAFAGLSVLMTWPVFTRLSTHLAGGRDDLWVHQWTFWWIRQALREGLNPFHTPYLYAPVGVSLTSHNIAWFNVAFWLPLQAVVGRIAAYNLLFLAVITLNGFCMYLFAHTVTKSRIGAFVAGLIFGFWPYTLSHYDHANMMVLFWVPLSLYCLHQLIIKTSDVPHNINWIRLAVTAFSIAMIGITRWQLLIMSSPILIAYVIHLLFKTGKPLNKHTWLQLLLVAGLALLIMVPFATPLIIDQFAGEFADDVLLDEPQWGRTDLLAYFVPSIHNGLWRDRVTGIYENFVVNQFYTPYIGYITLLLLLFGLIWHWKNTWLWLLLALLYFTLALGPLLAVNGQEFAQIPMPYQLVEEFILVRLLRRPDRLNIFLSLPLAMIAAWGMQALLVRISNRRLKKLTSAVVILLILLAYSAVPFATTKPEIPNWYAQVAADGEEYAVLDLPINDRSYDKQYMQYQTTHGKPLATGHVSRLPGEASDFLDSVPLMQDLRQRDQQPDPSLTAVTDQLLLLHEAGIRYLVIHKAFANGGLQDVWRDWLAFSPSYEDEELLVYRTKPEFGQDYAFTRELTPELGLIDVQLTPADAVQAGIIAVNARWGTAGMPDHYDVCLQLINASGDVVQIDCFAPDPKTPTNDWPVDDVRRGSYAVLVGDDIEPGPYVLMLSLAEAGTTELVGATAPVGGLFLYPNAPTHAIEANWQDDVHLTGYDIEQEQDRLTVTLFWQAQRSIESSYKLFLHLVDKNTGDIVAQVDAIPRDWTYPTTSWQTGEIIRDEITMPYSGTFSDQYELRLGVYDELTGQRLLVDGGGSTTPQEYLTLSGIEP